MIAKNQISNWGGWLFLLLCLILLMGYSGGMITLFVLFCMFFTLKIRKLDTTAKILAVFSVTYIFFSFINGAVRDLSGMLIYGLPWFYCYCYGKYVANGSYDERSILDFILIVALLGGLPVYGSILFKIISTGSLVDTSRLFYAFGDETRQASGNGVCLDVFIGYAGLTAFFLLKQWSRERWLYFVLFLLSLLVAINVVTRFPIVVATLCFILVMFDKNKNKPWLFLVEVLMVVGVVFILYSQFNDVGAIFEAYAERNEDIENVKTLSDRTYRWTDAFVQMRNHPFGWYNSSNAYTYVHNMWLDIAKYSGAIPFVLLVIVTIKSFVTNRRILKLAKTPLAYIFLSLNICFTLVAFVQPVYGSLSVVKCCMIWGLQSAYLERLIKRTI